MKLKFKRENTTLIGNKEIHAQDFTHAALHQSFRKSSKKSFCIILKVPKTFSKAKRILQICLATKAIGSESAMTGWLILALLTCKRHMST